MGFKTNLMGIILMNNYQLIIISQRRRWKPTNNISDGTVEALKFGHLYLRVWLHSIKGPKCVVFLDKEERPFITGNVCRSIRLSVPKISVADRCISNVLCSHSN